VTLTRRWDVDGEMVSGTVSRDSGTGLLHQPARRYGRYTPNSVSLSSGVNDRTGAFVRSSMTTCKGSALCQRQQVHFTCSSRPSGESDCP
jgi:hypothetical protein